MKFCQSSLSSLSSPCYLVKFPMIGWVLIFFALHKKRTEDFTWLVIGQFSWPAYVANFLNTSYTPTFAVSWKKQYTEPLATWLLSWTFMWNSTNSLVSRLGQISRPWYWNWRCNFWLHESLRFSSPSMATAQTELLWHAWHYPTVNFSLSTP